ncbi:MAG: hypothetical protein K0R70_2282, partial [Steroidobacteraceae bacterium]|nr:hypothetical protein [Steroidobacteraceae bacterium]
MPTAPARPRKTPKRPVRSPVPAKPRRRVGKKATG